MQRLLFSLLAAVLFSTLSYGNVLAVCGDGILDAGEGCDDGPNNGTVGSCCTLSCTCATPWKSQLRRWYTARYVTCKIDSQAIPTPRMTR